MVGVTVGAKVVTLRREVAVHMLIGVSMLDLMVCISNCNLEMF